MTIERKPIQRYKKSSPCPICTRYGTAYKDKCHGFLTSDERYAYCSRIESETSLSLFDGGITVYRHPLREASFAPLPLQEAPVALSAPPTPPVSLKVADGDDTPSPLPARRVADRDNTKTEAKEDEVWDAEEMGRQLEEAIKQHTFKRDAG
jgi:hypothetical protein